MMQETRTNADLLLTEFITMHNFFMEHPKLLAGDSSTAQVYEKLMSVRDVDDLKDWLRAMATSDRAKNLPRGGGVVWEDVLGRAERIALKMDEKELSLAADGMARIADNGYRSTIPNDLKILDHQRQILTKDAPDTIVLFKHGKGYFAYGKDADMLFEKLAWQTTDMPVENGTVSWLNINADGMKVLRLYDIDTIATRPDVEIHLPGCCRDEEYKADRLAQSQQTIDSIRLTNMERDALLCLGQYHVLTEDNGIDASVSIDFIRFAEDDVSIITDSGREQRIVDGMQWYADSMNADYIINTGEKLQNDRQKIEHLLRHYDDVKLGRQLRTDSVMNEYEDLKSEAPDCLLLVKQWNFYEAMGDDAIQIANRTNYPLWDRDGGNGRKIPVVMLHGLQADRVALEFGDDNVCFKDSNLKETLEYMALTPSPLNDGLHSELHFNESGIKKTRNGEYMVWARISGVNLPDKAIPTDMGVRYSRLMPGVEKETTLKAVLQQSYGAEVFQMMNQQSKSASVKI